jgi:hypothetical protein
MSSFTVVLVGTLGALPLGAWGLLRVLDVLIARDIRAATHTEEPYVEAVHG